MLHISAGVCTARLKVAAHLFNALREGATAAGWPRGQLPLRDLVALLEADCDARHLAELHGERAVGARPCDLCAPRARLRALQLCAAVALGINGV